MNQHTIQESLHYLHGVRQPGEVTTQPRCYKYLHRPAYAKDVESTVNQLVLQRQQFLVISDNDPAAERAERQRRAALALTPVGRYRKKWKQMQGMAQCV